jgi:NAD-dependent deacetylase
MSNIDAITQIVQRLHDSARITILTGAGISAASGVPTFRGREGLWKSYSPQELATPEAFRRNPTLVWEWYNWRRELIAKCRPNPAHEVIALWSRRYPSFTLITQNVDGLHEKVKTENVVRFHGSIWEVQCWNGCESAPDRWVDTRVPIPIPPSCPYCGGLLRPGVVWFGEGIDPNVLDQSSAALFCDVFMAIGTSAQVYPAAALADRARSNGAFTVEVNLEATPASENVHASIQGPAETILQEIENMIHG